MRPTYVLCSILVSICLVNLFGKDAFAAATLPENKYSLAERYLVAGKLDEGEKNLTEHLQSHPKDAQARFGLGVIQVMQGVEHLMQSLYRHGLFERVNSIQLPFLRLPAPKNPNPEKISYAQMRKIYETLLADLTRAEATLSQIKDDNVKLPLRFGMFKLDFNGDGVVSDEESFWKIYARVTRNRQASVEVAENFVVTFDRADVYWLRGYCHLLSSFNEFILAHDWKEAFDRTGQIFFPKIDSAFPELPQHKNGFVTEIADLIALIHLVNFEVEDPKRMKSALTHLEKVISLSRETWKEIEAETDDDHEWIPSPKQTGVIPGVRVTQGMVDVWKEFQDEAEAILKGEKLIPHWRIKDGRGINLRRVFTEPRPFDLVLWVQGSSAVPYLEKGTLTEEAFWFRLQRVFRGQFMGFAVWFN